MVASEDGHAPLGAVEQDLQPVYGPDPGRDAEIGTSQAPTSSADSRGGSHNVSCMHCGLIVSPDRAMICDNCGRPFSPDAEAMYSDPAFQAAMTNAYDTALTKTQRDHVNWGGFWLGLIVGLGALLISAGSLQSASSGGGYYVVFWGAVLWGGWKALKSLGGG